MKITFFKAPKHMGYASQLAGKPVYEEAVFIRKQIPGDDTNVIEYAAKSVDFDEFHQEYSAFINREEGKINGTPLDKIGIDENIIKILKFNSVDTVEELSQLTDTVVTNLGPGFRSIRESARKWQRDQMKREAEEAAEAKYASLKKEIEELKKAAKKKDE
jgi:hypothetical protein